MSIFDKLKFWKKDTLPDLPDIAHDEPSFQKLHEGLAGTGDEPGYTPSPSFAPSPSFTPPNYPGAFNQQAASPPPASPYEQVIAAKLETVKAQLDTIGQRLEMIERKMQSDESWKKPYRQ